MHKYANYLSLVKQKTLEGRSGKFAKHLRWVLDLNGDFDTVCHVDFGAWFVLGTAFILRENVARDTCCLEIPIKYGSTLV